MGMAENPIVLLAANPDPEIDYNHSYWYKRSYI
jgi:malic enzyme